MALFEPKPALRTRKGPWAGAAVRDHGPMAPPLDPPISVYFDVSGAIALENVLHY